jgi:phosphatidylinositol alpha-1,6-mannosyltransferase
VKLLFIADVFPPLIGGSAAVYSNICRELATEATVVASKRHYGESGFIPGYEEADRQQAFPVIRIDSLRTAPLELSWRVPSVWDFLTRERPMRRQVRQQLSAVIERLRPDVVCIDQLNAFSWIGLWIQSQFRIPVVYYVHGEELMMPIGSHLYRREVHQVLRQADGFIVVSSFTRQQLAARGAPESKIYLVANGVDLERFTPGDKDEALLAAHGLRGRRVLLTVARVEERKGHDIVIAALPRILARVPDVAYLIVGEGTRVETLKNAVRDSGLQQTVVFTGPVPGERLADYYRSCDVFIMPNRTLANGDTEGFGLVFLEAAACARPVIGGNAGGVPDAVLNGTTGILVDGTSVEEVADAAIRLLADRTLALRMGTAGLAYARQCSWAARAAEFRAACDSVIRDRHATRLA